MLLVTIATLLSAIPVVQQPWCPVGPTLVRLGDCDGDGLDDIAVNACDHDWFDERLPGVIVRSGATGCVLWAKGLAPDARTWVIGALVSAGDFDRDGRDDLAVALSRVPGARRTRVEIRSGADGALLMVLAEREGLDRGHVTTLAGGGDFDGDGFSDIAVGLLGDEDASLVVHSGFDGCELARWSRPHLDALRYGADASATVEWLDLAWLPAADRGGCAELLVQASGRILALRADGRVRRSNAENLQGHLSLIGDLSGDGTADLAVGFVLIDGATLDVWSISSHLPVFPWSDSIHHLTVAALGDVDGDGALDYARAAHDFLGTQQGWIEVRSSSSDAILWLKSAVTSQLPPNGEHHGFALAAQSDLDGDGIRDFVTLGVATGTLVARSGREPARVLWRH